MHFLLPPSLPPHPSLWFRGPGAGGSVFGRAIPVQEEAEALIVSLAAGVEAGWAHNAVGSARYGRVWNCTSPTEHVQSEPCRKSCRADVAQMWRRGEFCPPTGLTPLAPNAIKKAPAGREVFDASQHFGHPACKGSPRLRVNT